MSNAEWITDRPPTEADGDINEEVRMRRRWGSSLYRFSHWSNVAAGVAWQHTCSWQPTAEPATPQPDWAALGWITHRQPTAKDADGLGEVAVPASIGATPRMGDARCSGFRLIVPGQPWWSQYAPEPGHPTAPSEPDRIAALEQEIKEHIRAQSVLAAALVKRLEALEGLPPDGAIPEGGRGVPGGIVALEQRVAELEARVREQMGLMAHLSRSTAEAFESLRADR
jgi:hypothetical protein